jgi:signal transduction histidine kinase
VPGEVDFWWRNPRFADPVLAVVTFATMSLVGGLFHQAAYQPFDLWAYLLTGLICLPLAARRVVPMTVLVVTSVAYVVYVTAGHLPGVHLWGPLLAFYSLAAQRPPRVTAIGAVLCGVVGVICGVALLAPPIPVVAFALASVGAAWGLGDVARQLHERNGQLADATVLLRREQQEHVERMLTQERLRIARELHDVVAHHMSVISVQAGLADYVFETDLPTVHGAVRTIGSTSREALEEMRRLLDLLRVSELAEDVGSVPRLEQLPALVERVRAAGVQVDLRLTGDLDGLPSGLQLAVFRVVQEAVTNVIKHAGPCRAEVVVRRHGHLLTATISNETRAAAPGDGSGYGLIGMRERARMYRGTLTAGHGSDGRYVVELECPCPDAGVQHVAR